MVWLRRTTLDADAPHALRRELNIRLFIGEDEAPHTDTPSGLMERRGGMGQVAVASPAKLRLPNINALGVYHTPDRWSKLFAGPGPTMSVDAAAMPAELPMRNGRKIIGTERK